MGPVGAAPQSCPGWQGPRRTLPRGMGHQAAGFGPSTPVCALLLLAGWGSAPEVCCARCLASSCFMRAGLPEPGTGMVQLAVTLGMPTLPPASELGRMCCWAALRLGTQTLSALPGPGHLLGYPSGGPGLPQVCPKSGWYGQSPRF